MGVPVPRGVHYIKYCNSCVILDTNTSTAVHTL